MGETYNSEKYTNSVLYFIKYCNNQYLGATKLNKLLYYLDFISFRDRGIGITGDSYIHLDYGPVPENIDEVMSLLKEEDKLQVEKTEWKDGFTFKFATKENPNLTIFDEYETKLLENICKEFSLWSTDKIVNQTHLEAPWFYSKPYEIVDFSYAKDIEFFTA